MKSMLMEFLQSMDGAVVSASETESSAVDTSPTALKNAAECAGNSAFEFGKPAVDALRNATLHDVAAL